LKTLRLELNVFISTDCTNHFSLLFAQTYCIYRLLGIAHQTYSMDYRCLFCESI